MQSGREQEQSIKDRKQLLFDDDPPPASAATGPGKPFALYLRETPAAPLPAWVKAALWAAGVVVALLLLGAVMKASRPKEAPRRGAELRPPAAPAKRLA